MLNIELTFNDIRNTIRGGKQGNYSQKQITQGNLKKAVNLRQFKKPRARKIRSYNIQISQDGFCCEYGKGINPDDRDDNKPGAGSDNDSDVTNPTPHI
ncbi:hypothetical protein N7481_005160 [Penicillium waksmanii]|uniref:uncharacterized protein n=1 Tax=Penicillium waksmanii TaxID=69791 RepID=UPI002547E3A6|nr:uncharacterized protein N7481_005160 [Penicillium waksmanii]KAJ5983061.1 hypothetical protein N7481_005160 [Penicillium waksmanii]